MLSNARRTYSFGPLSRPIRFFQSPSSFGILPQATAPCVFTARAAFRNTPLLSACVWRWVQWINALARVWAVWAGGTCGERMPCLVSLDAIPFDFLCTMDLVYCHNLFWVRLGS